MRSARLFSWLIVFAFLAGCAASAPASTPTPAASFTRTARNTRTPSATPTVTATFTATPTSTPHPPLGTEGPYLVYLRDTGSGLELIFLDADGEGQRAIPISDQVGGIGDFLPIAPRLSPDGKWLAFYTGSAGQAFGEVTTETADLTLNLMDLENASTRVVTALLSEDYPANFGTAAQEMESSGPNVEAFAAGLMNAFALGIRRPSWSPNGRYLAFAGQMDGLSADLYVYDTIYETIRRLGSGPEEVMWIDWSPDGKWIVDGSAYWVGEGMTYDVFASKLDGTAVHALSSNTTSSGAYRWLNNHTYFETYSANGRGSYNLRLVDVETGAKLTVWEDSFSALAIDPSGVWLGLFAEASYNNSSGPYVINLSTMHATPIKTPQNMHVYGMGAGGIQYLGLSEKRMFLLRDGTDSSLYFVSTDGTLSPSGLTADDFHISPDRKYILIIDGSLQVYAADGSYIRDVALPSVSLGMRLNDVIWRPDSSGLFLRYEKGQSSQTDLESLYAVDLLSGQSVLVEDRQSGDWVNDPFWINP